MTLRNLKWNLPALMLSVFVSSPAFALCQCVCMNGEVRAICDSAIDLPPICAPSVCPIVPPSIPPIHVPDVPPVGTTHCYERQVYNYETARYEWKEVCQ